MSHPFRVCIASVPDRENVVAELWYGDEMWGEIREEQPGVRLLQLYPQPDGGPWDFPLEEVLTELVKAERLLRGERL